LNQIVPSTDVYNVPVMYVSNSHFTDVSYVPLTYVSNLTL